MSRKSRLWVLLLPLTLIVGGIVLYRLTPETAWWVPPCLFHKFTGLNCPGCGTTRGLHALLHGHILAALRFNVLTISAIPLLLYGVANVVRQELTGAEPKSKLIPSWLPWTVGVLILAFWLARNIPAYPFTLLAPH